MPKYVVQAEIRVVAEVPFEAETDEAAGKRAMDVLDDNFAHHMTDRRGIEIEDVYRKQDEYESSIAKHVEEWER